MIQKYKQTKRGFSLIEILFVVAILGILVVVIGAFQKNVFSLSNSAYGSLFSQNEVRKIINPFVSEVRSASQSSLGSYPIATAGTSTFMFYTDTDSDGLKERIRYYLEDDTLKKGVLVPSGSPLAYDVDDEEIQTIISYVVATSSIFNYYDENYNGTSSTTPLSFPVDVSEIRLVQVSITVDEDPDKPPAPITVKTHVSIRNLKNNL